MKTIAIIAAIAAICTLTACGGGDHTVIGDVDTATNPPTVVSGQADTACRDASGKDVPCPAVASH